MRLRRSWSISMTDADPAPVESYSAKGLCAPCVWRNANWLLRAVTARSSAEITSSWSAFALRKASCSFFRSSTASWVSFATRASSSWRKRIDDLSVETVVVSPEIDGLLGFLRDTGQLVLEEKDRRLERRDRRRVAGDRRPPGFPSRHGPARPGGKGSTT